jgi:hypothetical protein
LPADRRRKIGRIAGKGSRPAYAAVALSPSAAGGLRRRCEPDAVAGLSHQNPAAAARPEYLARSNPALMWIKPVAPALNLRATP